MVDIEALPQVQELQIYVMDDQNTGLLRNTDTLINCSYFNVSIVVNGNTTDTLSYTLRMTPSEMEDALNDLETIQNFGKIVVKRNNKTFGTTFILLSRLNSSTSLPILQLESEKITLSCSSSANYIIMASLILTQNLTLAEGFYIGYNHTHSIRFTPVLPPNITQIEFEEEMNEMLKWVCEYPTPSASLSILYSNNFEGNHSDIDNSTAFCGGQSKKNPGLVWEDSAGLKNHHHVRNYTYSFIFQDFQSFNTFSLVRLFIYIFFCLFIIFC